MPVVDFRLRRGKLALPVDKTRLHAVCFMVLGSAKPIFIGVLVDLGFIRRRRSASRHDLPTPALVRADTPKSPCRLQLVQMVFYAVSRQANLSRQRLTRQACVGPEHHQNALLRRFLGSLLGSFLGSARSFPSGLPCGLSFALQHGQVPGREGELNPQVMRFVFDARRRRSSFPAGVVDALDAPAPRLDS